MTFAIIFGPVLPPPTLSSVTLKGFNMPRTVTTDGYLVTNDEAVELCAHHLKMAQLFFEATSEDNEANMHEIIRLLSRAPLGADEPAAKAAIAWLGAINGVYEAMKEND